MPKKLWQKGQSGNPSGRPKGAKNEFTQILHDFTEVWNGQECRERLKEWIKDPVNFGKYVEVMARLMPRQVDIDIQNKQITVMPGITLKDGTEFIPDMGDPIPEALPEITAEEDLSEGSK